MKKFAIVLAVVVGTVSASFAGSNCNKCKHCPKGYYPGQTFVTACGQSAPRRACRPVCKPVCKPVCNPCR